MNNVATGQSCQVMCLKQLISKKEKTERMKRLKSGSRSTPPQTDNKQNQVGEMAKYTHN